MPTASARFRRPRPQPRVISQLELLVSRLMDELGPVLLLVSANSRDGSQAWVEAFTEFRAFAHARWATIQESLSRACKYIALGADKYAAEFAEIAAEDADLASHLNDARARVSRRAPCQTFCTTAKKPKTKARQAGVARKARKCTCGTADPSRHNDPSGHNSGSTVPSKQW